MEWIKVTDRLPEGTDFVLVYQDGAMRTMGYEPNVGFSFWDTVTLSGLTVSEITHWMPLPESPKEPTLTWQYSTRTDPDTWVDATDSEYEIGQHLAKYNWRRVEK